MSHQIKLSAGCKWAVVWMDGDLMSSHRTETAAQKEIDSESRAFDRVKSGRAYLPRSIIHAPDGKIEVRRCGQFSTSWEADN